MPELAAPAEGSTAAPSEAGPGQQAAPAVRISSIFRLWLPLAISFELMMLEGPSVQGAIGRLPHPTLNLAAWGLAFSLALLVESPVIMLLATAIALVRDEDSYRGLRRFVLSLMGACTLVTALIAFTPLFDWIAGPIMGQPGPIVAAARPGLQIMLLWTAAIAWRRFYQGVLVREGQTRFVSLGTAVRLTVTLATVGGLLRWGRHLSGVQVGAITLMAAVMLEAIAATVFALPIARRRLLGRRDPDAPLLTQAAILKFHLPLAATTLLTLLAPPLTAAALARLRFPHQTLAAWPVTSMLMLALRGPALALQEITIAQAHRPEARAALRRFTVLVGLISTGATLLLALSPLLDHYMSAVLHLPGELRAFVRIGTALSSPLPLITAFGSWARGVLVAAGKTSAVYRGMGLNLTVHGAVLLAGIALHLPGMAVAATAFLLAGGIEYLYLARLAKRSS